ncbi:MAG TPA: YIP1 family protein, partial [Candidatus Acidoferrum sp.]|nr:YIP1 family protein [Candidatus Acidoferrum sp.]
LSFRGLYEVFAKPTKFFAELAARPKILVPLIVLAVILLVMLFATRDLIYQSQVTSPQFQAQLQGRAITPEMEAQFKSRIVEFGAVTILLCSLIAALFALFWGNFVFAGKAGFKQLWSVMLYGEIVWGVGVLIGVPIHLARQNLVAPFSLGILAASKGLDSVLYVILARFDIFIIWEIIVIGIGLSAVYGLTRGRGLRLSLLSMGMCSVLLILFTIIGKLIF